MKFGIFDLETSNLNADFGVVLCGCVKKYEGAVTTHRMDRLPLYEIDRANDRAVVELLRNELEKYDVWVSYNGKRFDIPFLNTRLMAHGLKTLDKRKHIDLLYQARYKLKLHSNRLAVVQEYLGLQDAKTTMNGQRWARAMAGYGDGWNYIVKHCILDVKVLEQAYDKLKHFVGPIFP
jgi:uncharacterized protein YprB with RNaseH-like and TPR domain